MSSCIIKYKYNYSIKDFIYYFEKPSQKIVTPPFTIGTNDISEWCLWIYPDGDSIETKGYFLVFLKLLNSNRSKIKVISKLFILNDKGKKVCINDYKKVRNFNNRTCQRISNFVCNAILFNPWNEFIVNNTLQLSLDIFVFNNCYHNDGLPKTRLNIIGVTPKLIENLSCILKIEQSNDCIIRVDNYNFKVDKRTLTRYSPVFKAMLNSGLREQTSNIIEIVDFNVNVVKAMLEYIYNDEIPDFENMVEEVFVIADKYEVKTLRSMAEDYLCSILSIKNVCKYFSFSDIYSIKKLEKKCFDCFLKNTEKIMTTKNWNSLVLEHPLLIEKLFKHFFHLHKICIRTFYDYHKL